MRLNEEKLQRAQGSLTLSLLDISNGMNSITSLDLPKRCPSLDYPHDPFRSINSADRKRARQKELVLPELIKSTTK